MTDQPKNNSSLKRKLLGAIAFACGYAFPAGLYVIYLADWAHSFDSVYAKFFAQMSGITLSMLSGLACWFFMMGRNSEK